jgi:hypothetical protein
LLDSAIADIRRLAHGIYPPLLVSGGLSPALRAAAKQAAVPVHVELNGLPRYPSAVEAALYHYCSEALQNAAKHGGPGTAATITACADVRMLSIIVSDTGRGFDPARKGTGLANMSRDRRYAPHRLRAGPGNPDPSQCHHPRHDRFAAAGRGLHCGRLTCSAGVVSPITTTGTGIGISIPAPARSTWPFPSCGPAAIFPTGCWRRKRAERALTSTGIHGQVASKERLKASGRKALNEVVT